MIETEFRKLNTGDEKAYQVFIDEFVSANEKIIPGSVDPKGMVFVDWLKKSEKEALGLDLPEDRVPADSYFLIRKADGKIL
jgi:predicted acetyltransferase